METTETVRTMMIRDIMVYNPEYTSSFDYLTLCEMSDEELEKIHDETFVYVKEQ